METEPSDELEAVAAELRQTAWLLGEFYRACHDAGLPEDVSGDLVADYHRFNSRRRGPMTIRADNDFLEVYQDEAGDWRWRRLDGANRSIVAESGEGYNLSSYAHEAAMTYNPNLEIREV